VFWVNNKGYSKKEFIKLLVSTGQTIPYLKTRKNFRREVREDELPEIYKRGEYVFAVVKD